MSLGSLFGGGKSTEDLGKWQSPFVNSQSLNSSLGDLTDPSKSLAGFSGGGLTGSYGPNGAATITADPTRSAMVDQLGSVYGDQVARLAELAGKIAPGYSDLRTAQMNDLQNQQTSAISNLRQNLESRRVLGSSFAQDAVNRTNSSFGTQRADINSQTYLQELAATNDLINQQHAAGVNQVQAGLSESNLEAGIAGQMGQQATNVMSAASQLKSQILGGLAKSATEQMGANARTQAELDEKANAGAGSFFGTLLTPLATAVTGPIGGAITGALTSALTPKTA